MPATTHCLIARRELPGYHPQKWCAVCGKAVSKNVAYINCEERDCPNLCHTGCLGDSPVYRCADTEQLRALANIPDPVTHVSETSGIHTPPIPDDQGLLTDPGYKGSQWEDLEKGELISLVEKLTEEASRSNIIIKSLQQDRELIIQHRELFASALKLADRLIASKQRESAVTTKNQPVSAFASTIDRHWESVCQGSEYWKKWWSSGRPQQLRHTTRYSPTLGITPAFTAAVGTDATPATTTAATPHQTTSTDTTPPAPVSTSTGTNTTSTAQSDTEETNSTGLATTPHPPPLSSNPTTRNRGEKRRRRGKTKTPPLQQQQQQGSKPRYNTNNRQPGQAPVKVCEYCKRRGHTQGDCYHRTADQRQERLLRQILAEGRRLESSSHPAAPPAAPSAVPPQLSLPQQGTIFPQPDFWKQNQGVQWIPPHQYPYITTPHQGHHNLTHFPIPSWHVQRQGVPVNN